MAKSHRDIYQETTDKLIAAIEAGTAPWQRDWMASCGAPVRSTGEHYQGVNVLLLSMAAMEGGYSNPHWMTFNQAKAFGAQVRKGERATSIVFFKPLKKDDPSNPRADADGNVTIPMLRTYSVFNAEQIDGLPDGKFITPERPARPEKERDAAAEAAMRSCGATIHERGGRAFYARSADEVTLPAFENFHTTQGFLTTMAHELTHWTGAPHRLARTKGKKFGDRDYAFEELVAEIGAGFIGARLGFFGQHIESHANYLASWLGILKNDKRAIFKAATLAQAAADMVLAGATGEMTAAMPAAPAAAKPTPAPQPAAVATTAPAAPQFELAF